MKEKIKLTQVQIDEYEWVLENIENIDWIENDEPKPFIMIEGWLEGLLDYEKSELVENLENAINSKEFFLIDKLNSLDLVVNYCKKLESEGYDFYQRK
tara:strand:- start:121 stop:414 length:294 start_codon:yes stop_codon:yes gene_type:complete